MSTPDTTIIVGASLAGATAASTLREEGFDGRIVLLGEEPELPYERPPLSKGYLTGDTPRAVVYLHEQSFYAEHDLDLRTGTRVVELDRTAAQVVLQTGQRLPFHRVLLATGAAPRRVLVPGADLAGICYLRDLADADALRERLGSGGRVVVVGAGWIGMEIAASARQHGLDVTVLDPGPVPLGRVLGRQVGEFVRDLHAGHGVRLLPGTRLDRFEGDSRVQRVLTTDGRRLDADLVVVGIGVQPRTQLAERAGLAVDNGIVVDELLTSSDPRVFAAGDVARARHPFYAEHVRVEHWSVARDQGAAAARSVLGRGTPYDTLPSFFSDQYDTAMEYRGRAVDPDQVVFRGDRASGQFVAFWLRDRRVLAGMTVNTGPVGDELDALIRSRRPVDPAQLADADVPLGELTASSHRDGARSRLRGSVAGRVKYLRRFVADRFTPADALPTDQLAPGEGRVLDVGGEKAAVYKDPGGALHGVSPICTHARCIVQWNPTDTACDCPCHGARFDPTRQVLRGPARKNLPPMHPPTPARQRGTR